MYSAFADLRLKCRLLEGLPVRPDCPLRLLLHRLKLRLQALQALFLRSNRPAHSIDLAHSELFTHLCEITCAVSLSVIVMCPCSNAEFFFGVLDLHDGCGKRGDLVFREFEVLHFGRAFNIDTRLL